MSQCRSAKQPVRGQCVLGHIPVIVINVFINQPQNVYIYIYMLRPSVVSRAYSRRWSHAAVCAIWFPELLLGTRRWRNDGLMILYSLQGSKYSALQLDARGSIDDRVFRLAARSGLREWRDFSFSKWTKRITMLLYMCFILVGRFVEEEGWRKKSA